MVLTHCSRWMYAIAGSGVVLEVFNYNNSEKKVAKTAWASNFKPTVSWDYNWDNLDYTYPTEESNKENELSRERKTRAVPTSRRHIFMIRHGQFNFKGKTDAEKKLTALGRKQADLVGQRLKDLKFNYSKIIRSTMTRAMETSDIIHKYLPDIPKDSCDLIREGVPIKPDPPSETWVVDEELCLKDGTRVERAFKKHFHRADINQLTDSYEIMVCHANVIRYFVCRLLQFPPQAWLRFKLHHCSITWVVIYPSGKVCVHAIGDSGFLSQEEMTTNKAYSVIK